MEKYLRQILQEGYLDPIAIALHILLTSERWINTQIASLFGRSCHIWAWRGQRLAALFRPDDWSQPPPKCNMVIIKQQ